MDIREEAVLNRRSFLTTLTAGLTGAIAAPVFAAEVKQYVKTKAYIVGDSGDWWIFRSDGKINSCYGGSAPFDCLYWDARYQTILVDWKDGSRSHVLRLDVVTDKHNWDSIRQYIKQGIRQTQLEFLNNCLDALTVTVGDTIF